ncbi:hypothetical protein G7Y89_g10258 [Cudoniella acicularis]|uniref:Uncharacterized protein n=1 Tax=Cudoniella acicularis TaxID=354080 RepID=A0A8H4RGU2_9HELO|nr:hypothetical protein G7Y89_g10258 [Cudoniella acicularis]
MQSISALLLAAAALRGISAFPQAEVASSISYGGCPPFHGNFTIHQYQLYPENAYFDTQSCLLYMGCLWNATVGIYNPYTAKIVDILEFPGTTRNPLFHIGGVGVDQQSGLVSIVVDASDAFDTGGQDISGTNYIMQWNPYTQELLYKINLTETTHGLYGGYQDVEQDPEGNVYVVGTYPSSILKVSKDGKTVTPWFVPTPPIVTTTAGLAGLAAQDYILLGNDCASGNLWRFDMCSSTGIPVTVPITPPYKIGSKGVCDGIRLPLKYSGTVLLVAEDLSGVSVFRSKDASWESAEYLGLVPWNDPSIFVTATVQIGNSLYMVLEPFGDAIVPGQTSGNRTDFPFFDITKQVEALVTA